MSVESQFKQIPTKGTGQSVNADFFFIYLQALIVLQYLCDRITFFALNLNSIRFSRVGVLFTNKERKRVGSSFAAAVTLLVFSVASIPHY